VGIEKHKKEILETQETKLRYQFVSDSTHQEMYYFFMSILAHIDKLFLLEVVFTIYKEIIMNANKANAKRLYFIRKGLDIKNPTDYQQGMKEFQEEVINRWEEQESNLMGSEFYIDIFVAIKNNELNVIVKNNAPLLPEEVSRIRKRIQAIRKYKDLSDAFDDLGDTTESAGLGLVLVQLLLKNSGIGSDHFKLNSDEKHTTVELVIPDSLAPQDLVFPIKEKIMQITEGIPSLPESLRKIIAYCDNPDIDINVLSREVEKNPALVTEIIKFSNHAHLMTRNKVNTISQAIKVIGLKGIKDILYVTGVRKILEGQELKLESIWIHSDKTSQIARELSQFRKTFKLTDSIGVGALLHDIGKMILITADRKIFEKLEIYQRGIDISQSTLIEEISLGISHTTLGGMLTRKWEFPPDLISMIEYHHSPHSCPQEYATQVKTVYLANMMAGILEGKRSYYSVDWEILKEFEMEEEGKMDSFLQPFRNVEN
jgi:putative nucleotidyltransferase with HDIG domain